MARAFFASIPLALALVAAVIVPVALTPGTFGFKSWPSAPRDQVADSPLREQPQAIQVAVGHAEHVTANARAQHALPRAVHSRLALRVPQLRPVATRAPASVQHGSGPGAENAPSPAPQDPTAPGPVPTAPAPSQPADGTSTQPLPDVAAAGPAPVLRDELPPAAPAATSASPPPSPVLDGIGRQLRNEERDHEEHGSATLAAATKPTGRKPR